METIKIAGVACRVDKLDTMTYEQLFNMAMTSSKYYQKKDAAANIKKELNSHGFTATKIIRDKAKTDNTNESRKPSSKGNSKKRK